MYIFHSELTFQKMIEALTSLEELRDAVNQQYPNISERIIKASNCATVVINKYK